MYYIHITKRGRINCPFSTPIEFFDGMIPVLKTTNTNIYEIKFSDKEWDEYIETVVDEIPFLTILNEFFVKYVGKHLVIKLDKLEKYDYEYEIVER